MDLESVYRLLPPGKQSTRREQKTIDARKRIGPQKGPKKPKVTVTQTDVRCISCAVFSAGLLMRWHVSLPVELNRV